MIYPPERFATAQADVQARRARARKITESPAFSKSVEIFADALANSSNIDQTIFEWAALYFEAGAGRVLPVAEIG